VSGWYSDKFGKRKPFVVAGYSPTVILKPLLYFAQTPIQVLAIRIPERAGKGFRGAPRDALIAESIDKKDLGKAFGFHRAKPKRLKSRRHYCRCCYHLIYDIQTTHTLLICMSFQQYLIFAYFKLSYII